MHIMMRLWRTAMTASRRSTLRHFALVGTVAIMLFTTVFTVTFISAQAAGNPSSYTGKPNHPKPNMGMMPMHKGKLPIPKQPVAGKPRDPKQGFAARPFTPSMDPLIIPLSPTTDAHGTSSDHRLDVAIPASAVKTTDVASAGGGGLQLVLTQIAPASGSLSGGHLSLGTYLLQIQDKMGKEVASHAGLHDNVAIHYHWPANDTSLERDRFTVTVNGSVPFGLSLSQIGTKEGAMSHVPATFDTATQSLVTIVPLTSSITPITFNTDSPMNYFGKPDDWQTDLHDGALLNTIPLDIPNGPGGLTPKVQLSYNSTSVDEMHNWLASSDWVGEGWSVDMGSITWNETNIGSCPKCTSEWDSSWHLNDPYGTSADLLPPNVGVDTYYDDTGNQPTATPLTWHTAPESHAKVVSFENPTIDTVNFPPAHYIHQPPCFRVWLPNGIMEEFGCTPNSRQYYPGGINGDEFRISAWKLDLITDPNGNQIHVTYVADMQPNPIVGTAPQYPRDTVLSTIEWDTPSCRNTQAACTGTAWQPQVRLNFLSSNAVAHANGAVCATPTPPATNRCDNSLGTYNTSKSAYNAPLLESTHVLNDLQVQVRTTGTGTWQGLHSYQFRYSQSTGKTITDPVSGNQTSTAGELLLTQFQEYGTDGTSTFPTQTFSYKTINQFYENEFYPPVPATNCGGSDLSWNTGIGNGCVLWAETYNTAYLATADNAQGYTQSYNWVNARNNQHGVMSGGTLTDPLACNGNESKGYPCNVADDEAWSRIVLNDRYDDNGDAGGGCLCSTWGYTYYLQTLTATPCQDCTQGMYWGNINDGDYLDYYNGVFKGFSLVNVYNADGSPENHYYYTTEGWGVYDTKQGPACQNGYRDTNGVMHPCANAPYWDLQNAASGHEYETQQYDVCVPDPKTGTCSYPLLKQTQMTYAITCPPTGVGTSPASAIYGNFDGHLVAELEQNNPVVACDVLPGTTSTYYAEGNGSPTATTVPFEQTTNFYNAYGQQTQSIQTGNDLGTTPTVVNNTSYITNDAITLAQTSATGTYMVDKAVFKDVEDGAGNQKGCTYTSYDGQVWAQGVSSTLTRGLATQTDAYATCTSGGGTGKVTTLSGYDSYGNKIHSTDEDATAGITGHTATTGPCTGYSKCTVFDAIYAALPMTQINALNQSTTTTYATDATGGYGQWPTSTTDPNGQHATTTYDPLGRVTSTTTPGETSGLTTEQRAYSSWCPLTGSSNPCLEVDTTQRINNTTTITSRAFFDGSGHLSETRTPGPNNQDAVQFAVYECMGHRFFLSQPFFVPAYTGAPGSAAFFIDTQHSSVGTSTSYDGLGRLTSTYDALSAQTVITFSVICGPAGTGDTACYDAATTIDADKHKNIRFQDALQRDRFEQRYTGSADPYTLYATGAYSYDYLGNMSTLTQPGGAQITSTYNGLSRKLASTDADMGSWTYAYDPNGNLTQQVDARGGTGTTYAGYDGLDRQLWRSTQSNGTAPFASYVYDSTANGNNGVGALTSESFQSGPTQTVTGSYSYVYDARGRRTQWSLAINSKTYIVQQTYNDADQGMSTTYPDGDVVATSYSAQDWLLGGTETLSGTTTTLATGMLYNGQAGAAGLPSQVSEGNGLYTAKLAYNLNNVLNSIQVQLTNNQSTLFSQARQYDAVSNVVAQQTAISGQTDNESFCYDEQNRLIWAGTAKNGGTIPSCAGTITAGTLTAAQYQQPFGYDTQWRLKQGGGGTTYSYGDTAHLHAVTSTSNGYTAKYDAVGNMTCRAPNGSENCAGATLSGQQLGYDTEGHLISWKDTIQNKTATNAYDGSGQRVQQQTTNGANQSITTVYLGNLEEIATQGATTTTTKYYTIGSRRLAERVGSTLYYRVADGLGSATQVLNTSGAVVTSQLFGPYGNTRYSTGAMPSDADGFTGQRQDALSGLDYFNARFYDPTVGQFITADDRLPGNGLMLSGLNRYGYVGGNPETLTDPTGHCFIVCGAIAGGIIGGLTSYIPQVVSNVQKNGWSTQAFTSDVNWGDVGKSALVGALIGGGGAALAPLFGTTLFGQAALGATLGAGGQAVDNALHGRKLTDNLGTSALLGAGAGVVSWGAGKLISKVFSGECGNSFAPETPVATPSGEQAIASLNVGDQVEAYDPTTGISKAEPIQHVFINHDTNLVDVTLANDKPTTPAMQQKQQQTATAAHDSQAPPSSETIHTTTEHPFLTNDRGFVDAVKLVSGEHVTKLDGSLGVVVAVQVVPGQATRYNLTVKDIHTYAVGIDQWVVHNVGCNRSALNSAMNTPNGYQAHHIIPCECMTTNNPHLWSIIDEANQEGFNFNGAENGINLPTSRFESQRVGLPYHDGSHGTYNDAVWNEVVKAQEEWIGSTAEDGTRVPARVFIQGIVDDARRYIQEMGGGVPLT